MHVTSMMHKVLGKMPRKGAATVEFALCLPLILLLVFGAVEATDAIFLQQALTTAAYEGARAATVSTGTTATAQAAANAVLTARNITGATVTVSPGVTTSTAAGTNISVTVTTTVSSSNSMTTANFAGFMGKSLSATVVMVHR